MPGHVDEAELEIPLGQMGEPEVDGDAARLLLRPAVAVDPGQGQHQAGLAVIDVPGGADDDATHGMARKAYPAGFASTSRAMRLIVALSALVPKRAITPFMIGPMAAGPESACSATISSTAARICPSSTCAGR